MNSWIIMCVPMLLQHFYAGLGLRYFEMPAEVPYNIPSGVIPQAHFLEMCVIANKFLDCPLFFDRTIIVLHGKTNNDETKNVIKNRNTYCSNIIICTQWHGEKKNYDFVSKLKFPNLYRKQVLYPWNSEIRPEGRTNPTRSRKGIVMNDIASISTFNSEGEKNVKYVPKLNNKQNYKLPDFEVTTDKTTITDIGRRSLTNGEYFLKKSVLMVPHIIKINDKVSRSTKKIVTRIDYTTEIPQTTQTFEENLQSDTKTIPLATEDMATLPTALPTLKENELDIDVNLQKNTTPTSNQNMPTTKENVSIITGILRILEQKVQDSDKFKTMNVSLLLGTEETKSISSRSIDSKEFRPSITETLESSKIDNPEMCATRDVKLLLNAFSHALDEFDQKFYAATSNKLISISPAERHENGISFVQSGLFLNLLLMALSTEVGKEASTEMNNLFGLNLTNAEKCIIINETLSALPKKNNDIIFRWSTRLILGTTQNLSQELMNQAAAALRLQVGTIKGSETNKDLAHELNSLLEKDSGGAIRNTFEPEELSEGVSSIAMSMVYLRARWRSAPTVLNGSRTFRDAAGAPVRSTRMIRINDVMRYANFEDWRFEAIEVSYATPGLNLLLLVPHGTSIRKAANLMEKTSVKDITKNMVSMRLAVTMPLYTLRMTLLLPSKLQAMGINNLLSGGNTTTDKLKLSHAVQRLMFWSEAGRYAFKDDGIEWDEKPEMELIVDRPYLFYVRWHNITIMNGNFAL